MNDETITRELTAELYAYLEYYVDLITDEVNCTFLAESVMNAHNIDEYSDEAERIFDLALSVADKYEKRHTCN